MHAVISVHQFNHDNNIINNGNENLFYEKPCKKQSNYHFSNQIIFAYLEMCITITGRVARSVETYTVPVEN